MNFHPARKRCSHLLLIFAAGAGLAAAQTVTAVVDAASNTADVSPGALATVYGNGLSSGSAAASSFPTTLAGVTVTVNGVPSPLLYVSPSQINIQIPYEVRAGGATAIVYSDGYQSNSFNFDVYQAAPGIFQSSNQDSISQNADGSLNSQSNPAAPGSVVVVYLTGIGPLDNPVQTGQLSGSSPLSRAALSATATIGGQPAQIQFLGLTPGFLGLAQANLLMPNVQDGDYPLVITIGGSASNAPYIAIAANGVFGRSAVLPRKINARLR